MHISEGILSGTTAGQGVLLAGAVAAVAGTFVGLRRLDEEQIPKAAVLGSAFFVASAIQVPMLGSSVHLILSGLMGLVLGWAVFPVVLVGLILQLAFFSIGGPTVLGLNTVIMALPGVVCYYLFGAAARGTDRTAVYAAGFAAGALGVVVGALLSSMALLCHRPVLCRLGRRLLCVALGCGLDRRAGDRKRRRLAASGTAGSTPRGGACAGDERGGRWLGSSCCGSSSLPHRRLAHKLNVFAHADGAAIAGRAYFSGDIAARQIDVIARDATGREIDRTKTDDEGKFTLPVRMRTDYHLTAETADGHAASYVVSAAELPCNLPNDSAVSGKGPASSASEVQPRTSAAEAKSGSSSAGDSNRCAAKADRVDARTNGPVGAAIAISRHFGRHRVYSGPGWSRVLFESEAEETRVNTAESTLSMPYPVLSMECGVLGTQ